MKIIKKEVEYLTISIQAEELKMNNIEQNTHIPDITYPESSVISQRYFDNNYFWKDYNVNIDLSDL
jgi:hypothetical protein